LYRRHGNCDALRLLQWRHSHRTMLAGIPYFVERGVKCVHC
jgi:hypothetical protein